MARVSRKEFERLVAEGIDAIPEKFLRKLANVVIVVSEAPTHRQLAEHRIGKDFALLGCYEGVPLARRWHYTNTAPDKITIFRRSIEAAARTEAEIRAIVRDTVWHEIAHHFGLDEPEVRRRESARKQKHPL